MPRNHRYLQKRSATMARLLTLRQRENLQKYKYKSTGWTIADPMMQLVYDQLFKLVPWTWSPSLITSAGIIINITTMSLLVYYSPDAVTEAPRILYLLAGIGVFAYLCLDALDGNQARRTDNVGPLEELFDHGCDALSTALIGVGTCIALQLGQELHWMMIECFLASYLFYQVHWQTYISGIVICSMIDPTEGLLMISSILMTDYFIGPSAWRTQVPYMKMELRMLMIYMTFIPAVLQTYNNMKSILRDGKTGKSVAGTNRFFPILPITIVLGLGVMVAWMSPSHVYENNPCLYLLTFGITTARITNTLLVCVLTKDELPMVDSGIIAPLLLLVNQYFHCPIDETLLLKISLGYISQDILRYFFAVALDICDTFEIYCFDIINKPS